MTPEENGDAIRSAPVPCVCGAEARVETSFGSRCDPYRVVCSQCPKCADYRPTRAGALAGWAEVVAKAREVTP